MNFIYYDHNGASAPLASAPLASAPLASAPLSHRITHLPINPKNSEGKTMTQAKQKKSYAEVKAEVEAAEKNNPESPELIGPKSYVIGGKTFVQDYLNIDETIAVTALFDGIDWEKITGPLNVLQQFSAKGVLPDFFRIVLKGDSEVEYSKIRPLQAVEIISDFFFMNEVSEIFVLVTSNLPKMAARLSAAGIR